MEFLNLFLIIFGLFAASFLLINVRYLFGKGEFRGSCASNNPHLQGKVDECGLCGRKVGEECKMPEVKP